jgi:hypothetical protein
MATGVALAKTRDRRVIRNLVGGCRLLASVLDAGALDRPDGPT